MFTTIASAVAAWAFSVMLQTSSNIFANHVDEMSEMRKKLAKAAQVAKKKAEKAAAKAAAGGAEEQGGGGGGGGPAADAPEPAAPYSFVDAGVLMSTATPEEQRRVYAPIRELGTGVAPAGQEV